MEEKVFEILKKHGQNTKECTAKLMELIGKPVAPKVEVVVEKVVERPKEVKKIVKKKGGR